MTMLVGVTDAAQVKMFENGEVVVRDYILATPPEMSKVSAKKGSTRVEVPQQVYCETRLVSHIKWLNYAEVSFQNQCDGSYAGSQQIDEGSLVWVVTGSRPVFNSGGQFIGDFLQLEGHFAFSSGIPYTAPVLAFAGVTKQIVISSMPDGKGIIAPNNNRVK